MLYFSKLRVTFVSLICLFFILITSFNFIKFDHDLFKKKINLGLDLQGGSYLLLEIDNDKVEVEIAENVKVEIVKATGIQSLLNNTPEVKK